MAMLLKTDGTITEVKPSNCERFTEAELETLLTGETTGLRVPPGLFEVTPGTRIRVNDGDRLLVLSAYSSTLDHLPTNGPATFLAHPVRVVGDALLVRKGEL